MLVANVGPTKVQRNANILVRKGLYDFKDEILLMNVKQLITCFLRLNLSS